MNKIAVIVNKIGVVIEVSLYPAGFDGAPTMANGDRLPQGFSAFILTPEATWVSSYITHKEGVST